jgi:hypothetical protein
MKNPWMSLWLSAANGWAGAARGLATAEMRRQQKTAMTEMARQMSGAKPASKKPTISKRRSKTAR